ncbi:MAG: glycosyltransferase [Candidatus Woesearchaeota archaeon]
MKQNKVYNREAHPTNKEINSKINNKIENSKIKDTPLIKNRPVDYTDTTVIIPTLNEEPNIVKLIGLIKKYYPKISVMVADDGSRDRTQEKAAMAGAFVINRRHESIKGLTASVLHAARLVQTKYLVVIDGDLQHPPERIGDIVQKLRDGYDIVVAVRVKVASKWSFYRRVESYIASLLGKIKLIKKPFPKSDLLSGFFGVRTSFFNAVYNQNRARFVPEGFKVLLDLLKSVPEHTKVAEIGYIFGIRTYGKTKISSKHVYYYLKSLAR